MLWCVPFGDVTHRRWQPHTAATPQHSAAGPTTLTSDSRCSPCPYMYFPAVRQAGPSPSSQATIKFAGCLMPFTLTILFLYLRLAAEYALWHHQTAVQLKRVIRSFKSRPAMFLNSSWASEGAGATHMPGSMALSYVSSTSVLSDGKALPPLLNSKRSAPRRRSYAE